MPIWFLMVFALNTTDMTAGAKLHISTDYRYNNEESCNQAGTVIANELQSKLPATAKVMFVCQSLDYQEIKKAMSPSI